MFALELIGNLSGGRVALAGGQSFNGQREEISELFDAHGRIIPIAQRDKQDTHSWAHDSSKLARVVSAIRQAVKRNGAASVVNYVLYVTALKVAVAIMHDLWDHKNDHPDADRRESLNLLSYILKVLRALLNKFDPERVNDDLLDARIQTSVRRRDVMVEKVKKLLASIVAWFKRLIVKVKEFFFGKSKKAAPLMKDPDALLTSAVNKLAQMDGACKYMGMHVVSTEKMPGLPPVHTDLRDLQTRILRDEEEPARGA